MLIGQDFDKIHWEIGGVHFLEPNAFIGDALIFLCAAILAIKTRKIGLTSAFFINWQRFYWVFGTTFLLGGFGHLLYYYFGVPGKYPSWFMGLFATYFIEQAMGSLVEKPTTQRWIILISKLKLVLVFVAMALFYFFNDITDDPQKGLALPTLNSTIGLFFCLGVLAFRFKKTIHPDFSYLLWSVLLLVISGIVQGLKLNIHPWLDRNDISHIFLITSLFLYYRTILGYSSALRLSDNG